MDEVVRGAGLLGDAALVRSVSGEIVQAAAALAEQPLDPSAAARMHRALGARSALARKSLRRLQRDVEDAPGSNRLTLVTCTPNGPRPHPTGGADLAEAAGAGGDLDTGGAA